MSAVRSHNADPSAFAARAPAPALVAAQELAIVLERASLGAAAVHLLDHTTADASTIASVLRQSGLAGSGKLADAVEFEDACRDDRAMGESDDDGPDCDDSDDGEGDL